MVLVTESYTAAEVAVGENLATGKWWHKDNRPRRIAKVGMDGSTNIYDTIVEIFYGTEKIAEIGNTTAGAAKVPVKGDLMFMSSRMICRAGVPINIMVKDAASTQTMSFGNIYELLTESEIAREVQLQSQGGQTLAELNGYSPLGGDNMSYINNGGVAMAWRRRGGVRVGRKYGVFEYCKVRTSEGNGVLHVVYRGTYIEQKWLSDVWKELHGAYVVDIRKVYGEKKQLAYYLCRYVTSQRCFEHMSSRS